jgi:hypothetical protein
MRLPLLSWGLLPDHPSPSGPIPTYPEANSKSGIPLLKGKGPSWRPCNFPSLDRGSASRQGDPRRYWHHELTPREAGHKEGCWTSFTGWEGPSG